jgi:outer membrane protein assembly factor BamB
MILTFNSEVAMTITLLACCALLANPPMPRVVGYRPPRPLDSQAVTEDWPAFLGPRHNGMSKETPLLKKWGTDGPPLVWELHSGSGYAGPAVVGTTLVFFHRIDDFDVVECMNAETGRSLWRFSYATQYVDRYDFNNGPRSSPIIDGNRVYTHGVEGLLHCLDLATGAVRWSVNTSKTYEIKQSYFGVGSTPLVHGDLLIVTPGAPGPGAVAYNKHTGKVVWAADDDWAASYATPVVATIAGQQRLLVFAGGDSRPPTGGLLSINPSNGQVHFRFPWRATRYESVNAATPVLCKDHVFISESYRRGGAMIAPQANGKFAVVWTSRELGAHFSTPIYLDGFLYGFDGGGQNASLVCVDAATGKSRWRKQLEWDAPIRRNGEVKQVSFGLQLGSLLHADGQFLALGEMGDLAWLDLTPAGCREISHANLFKARETFTLPVLSRGLLYVLQNKKGLSGKTGQRLLCYDLRTSKATSATHWPSFRGPQASGIADGQALPVKWNVAKSESVRWKWRAPGLAHSSPIVWDQQVIVTSAVSGLGHAAIKPGLYGEGTASDDLSEHEWNVYSLDKTTGALQWKRTARRAVPRSRRHIKATYANCSPATDGQVVVAHFGAEGLVAFDMTGQPLWDRDLGDLDVGAYDAPEYEWGPASSPIIHEGRVIVQVDTQGDDYLMACDVRTGDVLWRTDRDELPGWGTPTVVQGPGRDEIITNGSNFIRAYDPTNGKELWRLGGSSKITAPTPIFSDGLIVVCSGRGPEKPIFAIRPGGSGDLTLKQDESSNSQIAWHLTKRGPYMPTPLAYRGILYVLQNQGILGCYDLKSGSEYYRQRIPHRGAGFSASPIAADGHVYLPSEDGDVFVIRAGREFEIVETNPLGEILMASPAASQGVLFLRGEQHLVAIGK